MTCEACNGCGFVMVAVDPVLKLAIERCDTCNGDMPDDEVVEHVYNLAATAMDCSKFLEKIYETDDECDLRQLYKRVRYWNKQRGANGKQEYIGKHEAAAGRVSSAWENRGGGDGAG